MASPGSLSTTSEELTAGSNWEWRLHSQDPTAPWHKSRELALDSVALPTTLFPHWPTRWTVFYTPEERRILRAGSARDAISPPSQQDLSRIPENLVIDEQALQKIQLETPPSGVLDLAGALGATFDGRTAFAYATLEVRERIELTIYAGADYWMQWWVDGQSVFDTLNGGNRTSVAEVAHSFSVDLEEGSHVLVVRVISGSGGWAFASEATMPANENEVTVFGLEARRVFHVSKPEQFQELSFDGGDGLSVLLNAQPLPTPLGGMRYNIIPGIPASMLIKGFNMICRSWSPESIAPILSILPLRYFSGAACGQTPHVHGALHGWPPSSIGIQTGPVLGWATESSFSLTCRTNLRCEMTMEAGEKKLISPYDFFHKFEVTDLPSGGTFDYRLSVKSPSKLLVHSTARTLGKGPWKIALLGDVYPFDDTWQRIADKVLDANPDLVIFSGDMVLDGRVDAQWDSGFFHPARELLSTIPFYPVLGNHEYHSPIFSKIFARPGEPHWCQLIGPALFVGIDGSRDWTPTGDSHQWLDRLLGESKATFKFIVSHFPPFSSGGHGQVGADGLPIESEVRRAREFLVPLLTRHSVNAIISGHDHFYERSELPGGLTGIVSAGAGSRLYKKTSNPKQNPHSTVFASEYHFCILEISPCHAEMTAISLDSKILDSKEWVPMGLTGKAPTTRPSARLSE